MPEASDGSDKFDSYAKDYLDLHQKSITITGEAPQYFAEYKLACIKRLIGEARDLPVLDYGCGIGMVTAELTKSFDEVVGFDPSEASLQLAKDRVPKAHFINDPAEAKDAHFGLVVMSGVLHHVLPEERDDLLRTAHAKLRPIGQLVVFEHNPFNPLTRRAVAMCEFDDDAILLRPKELVGRMVGTGYADVRKEFIVFFPRALSFLRKMEPALAWLPLGGQYMTVGRSG